MKYGVKFRATMKAQWENARELNEKESIFQVKLRVWASDTRDFSTQRALNANVFHGDGIRNTSKNEKREPIKM